jgi:4'-phosphopantetheinyl transferase
MVDVFVAFNDYPFSATQMQTLVKDIPFEMQKQAQKYRRWEDQQAYILGKFLLLHGLEKRGVSNKKILTDIKYTPHKRPYLELPFDFNITHSHGYVLCAMSDVCRVGIDIEKIQSIRIEDFKDHFTEQEFGMINQSPDKDRAFFNYWTIKEAVIKADGRGLAIPLKYIHIHEHAYLYKKKWFVSPVAVDNLYATHLVTDKLITQPVTVTKISLDK